MRRVVAILVVAIVIIAAGPKVVGVTNPMTANLDGGGFQIVNVGTVRASGAGLNLFDGSVQALGSVITGNGAPNPGAFGIVIPIGGGQSAQLNILAGTLAPTVDPAVATAQPGSLFQRRVDSLHGELWFKTGSTVAEWACIAGCAP